ncbi:MAG: HEAT repeat domain-containing protein [Kofleriaceae bacterium]|nr:HEAT repeat domain-containing protein [Kofleriaceae bacterium]
MFRRALAVALLSLALPATPAHAGFDWLGRIDLEAEDLHSSDAGKRRAAVLALAGFDAELAKPYLLEALDDDDDEVRLEAGRALGRGKVAEATGPVIDWLGDVDPKIRAAAADILGDLATPEGTQALIRSLGDADATVRVRTVLALGKIGKAGSDEVVVPLVSRLDDDKTDVRRATVEQLEALGDRRAVIPLIATLDDTSLDVRKAAIKALGAIGDATAVPALIRLLDDPAEDVRGAAVAALGNLGAADATEDLVERLGSGSDAYRGKVALALGQIARAGAGGRAAATAVRSLVEALAIPNQRSAAREALRVAGAAAVPALIDHLDGRIGGDPREVVMLLRSAADARATAALVAELDRGRVPTATVLEALAATGDPDAIVPVLGLTADDDPELRLAAMEALRGLLGDDARAADVLLERLDDQELEVRVLAIEYLGLLHASRAVPRLADLTAAGNPHRVRLAAIDALGEIGLPEAAPALVTVLREGPGELHGAAATALSYLASPDTVEDLLELARDDRSSSRHHVVRALGAVLRGQAGSKPAVQARRLLADLAEAGTADVSTAAIASLAAIGDRAVEPGLLDLLDAGGPDRQRAAAWALGELGDPAVVPQLVLALDSKDDRVTADVAWALGEIAAASTEGRAAVVEHGLAALVRAAKKGGWATAIDATGALARIAEPSTADDLGKLIHHRSKLVRVDAVLGLGALAAAGAATSTTHVAGLVSLLEGDTSPRVREAAARTLGRLGADADGARAARAALEHAAATDRDDTVKATAAAALAGELTAPPPRDEWRVFYVVDPTADDKPVKAEPYFVLGADGLAWATYTDARGDIVTEHFPAGDAIVAPQSRESEY